MKKKSGMGKIGLKLAVLPLVGILMTACGPQKIVTQTMDMPKDTITYSFKNHIDGGARFEFKPQDFLAFYRGEAKSSKYGHIGL